MRQVFAVINEMMANRIVESYAIGGAIGASFYIEAISTEDIDTFVQISSSTPVFEELSVIYSYLEKKGYFPKNEFVVIGDWDVQFLVPADGSLELEAVMKANIIRFYDQDVRVMMPEYLVAIALATGRPKDIARVHAFIEHKRVNIEELEILVNKFSLEEEWKRLKP